MNCDYCAEEDATNHEVTFEICCPGAEKACFDCLMSVVNTSTTCSRCERQLEKKIGKIKSDAKKRMQMLQGQKTLNRANSSGNLGVSQSMRPSKMNQSQVWQNQSHHQMGN